MQEVHILPGTAAILWGTRTLAVDAERIRLLGIGLHDGFNPQIVFPVIAEIILIRKAIPDAKAKVREADCPGLSVNPSPPLWLMP